jgi:hypothetical protein
LGNFKGRDSSGDLGANEENIKINLRKVGELLSESEAWSLLSCHRKNIISISNAACFSVVVHVWPQEILISTDES